MAKGRFGCSLLYTLFPFEAKSKHTHCQERCGFSNLRVPLPIIKPTSCVVVVWPFYCHPVGTGALGDSGNADTLSSAISVSNKLSFVSNPRVSCLLPPSMEL